MKPIGFCKECEVATAVFFINLLIAVLAVLFYKFAIAIGHSAVLRIASWCPHIAGDALFFGAGYLFTKLRPERNGILFALAFAVLYASLSGDRRFRGDHFGRIWAVDAAEFGCRGDGRLRGAEGGKRARGNGSQSCRLRRSNRPTPIQVPLKRSQFRDFAPSWNPRCDIPMMRARGRYSLQPKPRAGNSGKKITNQVAPTEQ